MTTAPLVGDIVHGYLDGYFGSDHYSCSRVEAFGADWAIIRHLDDGQPCAAAGGPVILEVLVKSRDDPDLYGGYPHTATCPNWKFEDE